MTREEARGIIKSECYIFDPLNLDRSTMVNTALDMAIIALERQNEDCISRESVLDKIRAEVKSLGPELTVYDVVDGNCIKDAVWETLVDVLQIIDKYKKDEVEKNEN